MYERLELFFSSKTRRGSGCSFVHQSWRAGEMSPPLTNHIFTRFFELAHQPTKAPYGYLLPTLPPSLQTLLEISRLIDYTCPFLASLFCRHGSFPEHVFATMVEERSSDIDFGTGKKKKEKLLSLRWSPAGF